MGTETDTATAEVAGDGRVCDQCSKPFESAKGWAKFCSDTCRIRAHRKAKGEAATVDEPVTDAGLMLFRGTRIGMRGAPGAEEMCLTDMWRANGSPDNKTPSDWKVSKQARDLEDFLMDSQPSGNSGGLISTENGKPPSTWAHWQLAFAYAKYLSPAFHAWVNQAAREKMTGFTQSGPSKSSIAAERERRLLERERRLERDSRAKALSGWADYCEERQLVGATVVDAYRNEAASIVVGRPLLESRPTLESRLYTAGDIGAELSISAIAVGKLAREAQVFEVDGFGLRKISKSQHNDSMHPHWVYNDDGRRLIVKLHASKAGEA